MKQKLLQFLFVIAAIITAIPIANAADYTFSTAQDWITPLNPTDGAVISTLASSYPQGAASDGKIYTVPGSTSATAYPQIGTTGTYYTQGYFFGNGTQSYWSGGSGATAYPYNTTGIYYYLGPCIASDDNGVLWVASRRNSSVPSSAPWAVGARALTYFTTRPTSNTNGGTKVGIDLNSAGLQTSGRADLMSVYGNPLSSSGGYFWFVKGNSTTIECIMLKNGSTTNGKKLTFTAPIESKTNQGYVKQISAKRVLYNAGSKYDEANDVEGKTILYMGTLNGNTPDASTSISWEGTGLTVCRTGATAFMLAGHEIIAYSKSATQIELYDFTDKVEIGTITPFSAASTNNYVTHSMDAKVISSNKVDLYIYTPTQGASKYTITASAITNPVTSLSAAVVSGTTGDVKVSWAKPSAGNPTKYAVSYSTDGGSSWSTEVETTNLNYTYANLANGTYTFKVRPYYGGSSTWGQATNSNSVNVINAVGAPISNLAYTYLNNTETNVGRQDITLTWNAPTGMVNTTVTGYKVYRNGSLLTTLGADALTYTNTGVKQNYTYKVVPTFDGLTEDASLGLEVTTTEVQAGVLVAPVISETRNYEGYSLVEIFFKMPNYAPYKPLYFNLYRDGKLIQGKLQSYNTLDESLVRASVETTVKYQVEAVYGSAADVYPPIDSVKSDITTLVIAPRDWAKTGYILQEIYNVPITDIAADKKPNLFDNNNYYRQGQFRDGKWYIAQRSDNLSKQDEDPNSGGGQIDSNVEGATGGILVFNAENADQVKSGYEKIFTKSAFENVGIAMDDAGTLFVRNNNFDKLKATVPTGHGDEGAWGWMKDAFERRITEGTFYKRNADGTYSEVATKLDLSKIWTDNRWIDRMYFTGLASNGQVIGRSDYYHMWGDVLSAEGGYLILSPSWTRTAFKVKIANGAYVSHEIVEFNRYENTGYLLEPKTGTENYGFHLDGRDDVTVQIRSNGYYGVHEWSEAGTTGWHPIYTADSRINNAGGASIQAFGEVDDTGRHTGELFVITPQSMHSHNVGDFLISRATKENADDYADEGSLMPSTPVAQYIQTDARSNSTATNANGNWFHAEKGTYASAMKDDDECVDIYQYVPGTRFARYRLIPSNQFPPVQPTLDITTAYNDDKTDITHFDGVATWQRPAGFGRSTGSANAKVVSYLFEMYNNKNELVTSAELPELYKTDGTPVDDEYVYDFNYTDTTGNNDIDFGRYSVNVRVKYQTKDGLYHISDPLYAEDIHDYPAEAVQNLATFAFKQANQTIDEWVKKDGKWVVEQKQVDNYRVEINFDKPDCDEPVSYYTVKALVNNKTDMIDITDFHLHKGMEVVNGIEQAILDRDADGKVIPTSVIPGTYDFENSKAPYYHKEGDAFGIAGQSRQNSVLTWHFRVPAGSLSSGVATASNGEEVVITDEPDQWTFIVVAHYAAKNTYIDKDREANAIPGSLIETGVEVVGEDNASSLEIYPIPASTEITIKSAETINSIVIYNEAGAEVMNLDGDNEMVTTVNIESLATGYYFVKVNNQAPVKIIKK